MSPYEDEEIDDQDWPPRFDTRSGMFTKVVIRCTLVFLGSIRFDAFSHLRPWSKDNVYMYTVSPDPLPRFGDGRSLSVDNVALFGRFYPGKQLADPDWQVNTHGSETGTINLSKWISDASAQQDYDSMSRRTYPPPLCSGTVEIFIRIAKLCQNGLGRNVSTQNSVLSKNTD